MEGTRYHIYKFELISIFEAECESSKKFVEDFLDSPNDESWRMRGGYTTPLEYSLLSCDCSKPV